MGGHFSGISAGVWTLLLLLRVPLIVVCVFSVMILDYLVEDTAYEAIRFVVLDHPEQLGMIGAFLFATCFALRFTAEAMIILVAPLLFHDRVGWLAWGLPRLIALSPAALLGARFLSVGQDAESFLHTGDPMVLDLTAPQALTCAAGLYYLVIGLAVAALPRTARSRDEADQAAMSITVLSFATLVTLASLLSAAVLSFFLFWDWSNVAPAQFVGPVSVILLWAFAASMYFFPIALASHATRSPLLLLLLAAALTFSALNWNDNHQIRTVTLRHPDKIPYFNQDLSLVDWLRAREEIDLYDYEHYPVFVVTAEGGALRSAYFTARVLQTLQDVCPAFAHHTIAISAVSGGSVGAASFIALNTLRQAPTKGKTPCDFPVLRGSRPVDALDVLYSRDLLSPLLGATLFPDALQRVLPFELPEFDRARAIECAFESALADATAAAFGPPCRERYLPLNRIYRGVHRWYETQRAFDEGRRKTRGAWIDRKSALNTPHLFLNTTDVTLGIPVPIVTGRIPYRLVRPRAGGQISTSIQSSFQPKSSESSDTVVDLPLSAAAFLSARFPYVMPAGWHHPHYRFLDGGLFEDSGAWFAEQIVRNLQSQVEEVRRAPGEHSKELRRAVLNASITVIVVRATPCEGDFGKIRWSEVPPHLMGGDIECVQSTLEASEEGWNEFASPLRALLRTRLGRGYDALESLRAYAKDQGKAFNERFDSCTEPRETCLQRIEAAQETFSLATPIQVREVRLKNDSSVHIPLTWTLSRQAKNQLDEAAESPLQQYSTGVRDREPKFDVGIAWPNYNPVVCALFLHRGTPLESAPSDCKESDVLPHWQRTGDHQPPSIPIPPSQTLPTPPPTTPTLPRIPPPPPPPVKQDAKPAFPEIDRCEGCPPKTP